MSLYKQVTLVPSSEVMILLETDQGMTTLEHISALSIMLVEI